jgi:hypothetical protein
MRKTKDEIKLKELCDERNSLSQGSMGTKGAQRMKELKNEIKNCQRRLMMAPSRRVITEKIERKKSK